MIYYLKGNTAQLHLRTSADLLSQYCSLKNLKYCAAVASTAGLRMRHTPCGYTKYSCVFQTLSCGKISRCCLLPNYAVLPKDNWAKIDKDTPGFLAQVCFFCGSIICAGPCPDRQRTAKGVYCVQKSRAFSVYPYRKNGFFRKNPKVCPGGIGNLPFLR